MLCILCHCQSCIGRMFLGSGAVHYVLEKFCISLSSPLRTLLPCPVAQRTGLERCEWESQLHGLVELVCVDCWQGRSGWSNVGCAPVPQKRPHCIRGGRRGGDCGAAQISVPVSASTSPRRSRRCAVQYPTAHPAPTRSRRCIVECGRHIFLCTSVTTEPNPSPWPAILGEHVPQTRNKSRETLMLRRCCCVWDAVAHL